MLNQRPNPSLNADAPGAGLRRRSGPPVLVFIRPQKALSPVAMSAEE